ncbi:MarR family transcriptional regulator [Carboxylicivirga sp. A043]|uniref:MarR family winged helix-turn-helix transcriptional regulator n=1 Tax=Carboxylicivirga litoralis TaxID=2816963 RepID=UPI0021CB1ACE|nr:MarR family transcriptional regulator [Carboxylicivirga sp. A043]MCU4156790.1 MarR family transcriptional regulator [Carboxylicivirga sp. A043]
MAYEQLKLENQLCFPVYAASRLITREYQPHLDRLGITYPQYLVFMLLWEQDGRSVNEITQKLILNTNTVTPLLKRMEKQGFITRTRSTEDSRKVIIQLTAKGHKLQEQAAIIPESLVSKMAGGDIDIDTLKRLKDDLNQLIQLLKK